jgi:hypothetical protein
MSILISCSKGKPPYKEKTMIKKGDKVIVFDNSFSLKVSKNGLKRGFPLPIGNSFKDSPVFEVLHTDMKLPAQPPTFDKKYNDTIIQAPDGTIYFIQSRFLNKTWVYKKINTLVEFAEKHKQDNIFHQGRDNEYHKSAWLNLDEVPFKSLKTIQRAIDNEQYFYKKDANEKK